ncbi:MAG TPA: hypothetical protein VFU33_06950 [Gaiellaceae bacterium]|nr:hypothetical protein [Gaiellaceae bacterium]
MPTYTFTLLIDGPDLQSEENIEALFEAGCDDALFGARDHIQYADFDREASNFAEAVSSAIRDIESTVPDARVLHIEPEEFVSLTAIADRTGKSRECVRLWAEGARGPGGFPSAVRWIDARTRVWRWLDVVGWLPQVGVNLEAAHDIEVVVTFNGLLEAKNHLNRIAGSEEREAVADFVREHEELRDLLSV